MAIELINSKLKYIAEKISYADNDFTFELTQLPDNDNLLVSLQSRFGEGVHWKTKLHYTFSDWSVKIEHVSGDIVQYFRPKLLHWFDELPFVFRESKRESWCVEDFVTSLCDEIRSYTGEVEVYQVFVDPPVWYEAHWHDFLLTKGGKNWLLHLGVSD